jgi:hypothetical protein
MPDISAAGTVSKTGDKSAALLAATPTTRQLLFAGTSVGTTCEVKYTDDEGTDRTLENGTITALPTSVQVEMNADLKVVTTGSPDFNLTVVI